jgi:hypothetical protein
MSNQQHLKMFDTVIINKHRIKLLLKYWLMLEYCFVVETIVSAVSPFRLEVNVVHGLDEQHSVVASW